MKNIFLVACIFVIKNVAAQNVGIGTANPMAGLHVADSSVLFSTSGTAASGPGFAPANGTGRKMLWFAPKAAFRAGYATSNVWDTDSIGLQSFATGYASLAKGQASFASGYLSKASGLAATAMGYSSVASGDYSTAIGIFSTASGQEAIAIGGVNASGRGSRSFGYGSSASGDFSISLGDGSFSEGMSATATGLATHASGQNSFASGSYSNATAVNSFASGAYTTASGNSSFAGGANSVASGITSVAMGNFAYGIGDGSAALGFSVFARAKGSATVGMYNDNTDSPVAGTEAATDRIFQVGNGLTNLTRTNALTILRNGNIGIGTLQPLAALHVANKSVVFTGPYNLPANPADPPVSNSGSRMMWYYDKAAFRAGTTFGDEWNKNNVGLNSVAFGERVTASGNYAAAMGFLNTASGTSSIAMGYYSIASGEQSVALGLTTQALGNNSFVSGYGTKAKSLGGTVIGVFNDESDNPSYTAAAATDRIFQVGNGNHLNGSRNNAITVLRNGNTGIGTVNPANRLDVAGLNNWDLTNSEGDFRVGNNQYRIKIGVALGGGGAGAGIIRGMGGVNMLILGAGNYNIVTLNGTTGNMGIGIDNPTQKLHVAGNILATGTITPSDIRYKKDIQPISDPIQKVEQLNGVTYQYRADEFPQNGFDSTKQVGLIAQNVEKVFPQLVFTDDKGYKAVDYTKLIPLLIEGMKAQQQQIEKLEAEVNKLKAGK